MNELSMDFKNTLLTPLVALSWLSVCLLVLGTGLIVFARHFFQQLFQISRYALLQIVRA